MKVAVQISNSRLSPEKAQYSVSVWGDLPFELSPDEAAEQLRDAWQRVVVPVQDGLKAISSPEES